MFFTKSVTTILIAAVCAASAIPAPTFPSDRYLQAANDKAKSIATRLESVDVYPSSTTSSGGEMIYATNSGWTSGFYPGMLWQLANYTGDAEVAKTAAAFTAGRASEANNTGTHDVGFMVFGSFGGGAKLSPEIPKGYKDIIFQGATSLASRYSPLIGMTRSWGSSDDEKQFEVIIDNLLNLEILFWSAANGGNATWHDMAVSHANKTGLEWIRRDGSTFHLVVFDPMTGAVISKSGTPQGMAVNSTWARGQGWAIYGFTMAYRYSQEPIFLEYARNVSEYYLAAAEADLIPKWDFDAPDGQYRDTSAAAITASAFLELSTYLKTTRYSDAAYAIMQSLTSAPYYADSATEADLTRNGHDCGGDNCTVIETDYYFIEALRRLQGAPF